MARKRKNDDGVTELVIKLVALLLLLGIISPQGRQLLIGFGYIAVTLVMLVIVSAAIFFGVRPFMRSKQGTEGVALPLPPSASGADNFSTIKVTADFAASELHLDRGNTIDQLRAIDWFQFEKVVAILYRKQGFEVTRRGGANPDGGIDLVIAKDGATRAVQCKQWKTWNVGVKAIREFLGALTDAGIQGGIFITLRGYTGEAKQLADKHGIEIVNESDLAAMLAVADAQFDSEVQQILRDTRKFCPKCEREMVLRTASKGPGSGRQFWGCSAYPRCRFTMPIYP